jgi:hypothetical protein
MADISGSGVMLKPGMVPPTEPLANGPCKVVIEAVTPENPPGMKPPLDAEGKPLPIDESFMARCVYPDGFVKEHQVKSVQDLLPKVINQIRSRYGFAEANITALPKQLKAGTAIELEVTNGA